MDKKVEQIISALEVVADECSSVAALIDTDDDYRIVWANRQLKEFLKSAAVAPEGMRWGGRCPFAFGIDALKVMDEVVRTGQPMRVEEQPFGARISTRFGETTYWNWKMLPAPAEDCPGCVIVMAENVTDRVARKALEKDTEPHFTGVVLDLPVGVATIDPKDYRILDANDIWLSYLPPECETRVSIGRTIPECVPYFESSGFEAILRRVIATREVFTAREFELKDPERGSIWWNITVRFAETGDKGEALLMTVWEVTEQVNARRRAESARLRAQTLLRVQAAISSSLALNEVLKLITDSARDLLGASAASVFMLSQDKRTFVPMAASGIEVTETCAIRLATESSVAARAVRERRPVTLAGQHAAELECLPALAADQPVVAIAAAPIEAEGEPIGVIEAYTVERRRFTNDELETLNSLAGGASNAIVNARLFEKAERTREQLEAALERERRIAQALQHALLAEVPPNLDGFRLAAKYEAGLREAEIGGDFFDIFHPCEGKLAIVIGDVAGKGLSAAIQIAAAKYGIRSYAIEDCSPGQVISRVNDLLYLDPPAGGFVSLFYAVADIAGQTLTYSNAGHEPPLLRHSDGNVDSLLSNGMVLGVAPNLEYEERTVDLRAGDRMLLYTDGITEARKESGEMLGDDRLRAFWSECCNGDAGLALDEVYHWAREFSEGHFHDDVAMLVVARESEPE